MVLEKRKSFVQNSGIRRSLCRLLLRLFHAMLDVFLIVCLVVLLIVLKTGPDRRFNRKKPEPKPLLVFLAHWTACAGEPD
jgi:hypothetical protein